MLEELRGKSGVARYGSDGDFALEGWETLCDEGGEHGASCGVEALDGAETRDEFFGGHHEWGGGEEFTLESRDVEGFVGIQGEEVSD